ncbi:MAG: CAP domain-containing protein [Oscillospiraceae bacterium]|nr:CAP domain-containing protein [Oscillospiraceae bacterium]
MKKLLSILFAVVIVCTICIIPASAASPKLNKTKVNLPIDYSITLKVSNADKVEWSTKDKSIAKIKSTTDNTAKIVGVNTGSTYIYAKAGGKTLKCKITVKKSFITAKNDEISISNGKTKSFTVSVTGSKKLAYNNSNPKVCTVTSAKWVDGKLKFTVKGKSSGTAQIKVYAKGYSKSTLETITVTVGNGSSLTVGGTASSEEKSSSTLTEAEKVVELVNAERAKKGLSALTMDSTLNEVAQLRAKEITSKFSHTRPDGTECFTAFDELGAKHGYAAENIAAGQSSAERVMNGWMNSQGHYDNIMSSNVTKIGVALVTTSGGYKYYWVQVFTD